MFTRDVGLNSVTERANVHRQKANSPPRHCCQNGSKSFIFSNAGATVRTGQNMELQHNNTDWLVTRLEADRIWGEPCAAFLRKGDWSIKPWLRIMVSLQEDVKLDCSYKVLAEDKPVLSNYPPKLHKKRRCGVLAALVPQTENNRKKQKIKTIIYKSKDSCLHIKVRVFLFSQNVPFEKCAFTYFSH